MRIHAFVALLLLTLPSHSLLADSFEVQGGYRGARGNAWKGGEFQIHYLSEDHHSFSFGAYFSSNSWFAPAHKRASHLEGGPEVRWLSEYNKHSLFASFQYAALSSGKAQLEHVQDVAMRVIGPRFLAGMVLPPTDGGLILNVGIQKGFEKVEFHGDKKRTEDFGSFGAFLGMLL